MWPNEKEGDDKRGNLSVGVRGREPLSGFLVEGTHWCLLQWWAGKGSLGINTGRASSASTSHNLTPSLTAREERSRRHP